MGLFFIVFRKILGWGRWDEGNRMMRQEAGQLGPSLSCLEALLGDPEYEGNRDLPRYLSQEDS